MPAVSNFCDLFEFCTTIRTGEIPEFGIFNFIDDGGEFAHLSAAIIIPTRRYLCTLSSRLFLTPECETGGFSLMFRSPPSRGFNADFFDNFRGANYAFSPSSHIVASG